MLNLNVFKHFSKSGQKAGQIGANVKLPKHLQFTPQELKQFRNILKDIRHAVVVSHIGPDVDALMSITSLAHVLQYNSMGTIRLVYEDYILEELREHQTTKLIALTNNLVETLEQHQPSHVFIIDINHTYRLTRQDPAPLKEFLEKKTKTIVLDHHVGGMDFKPFFSIIKPYASATELLFYLIKALDLEFNAIVAQDILAGILSDTDMLRYAQVDKHDIHITLNAISQLINSGADFNYAVKLQDFVLNEKILKYIKIYLNNLTIEGGIAYSYIKDPIKDEERMFVSRARQYVLEYFLKKLSTPIAFMITPLKDNTACKVSIRSVPPYEIKQVAEEFGGGGHPYASGIFARNMSVDELLPKLLQKLQNVVKKYQPTE